MIMLVDDVVRMCEFLGRDVYSMKALWSEDCWATDAHAMCLDDQGNGTPAWEEAEGFVFKQQSKIQPMS